MMTISIRLPKPDDLDAIVRLQRDALDSHRAVSDLAMELSGPHVICRVMYDEGLFVGFLNAWFVMDTVELTEIAVEPSQRLKGHGRHLIRWLVEYAKALSAERLLLEVRETNRAARALYESFGFKVDGVRAAYYKNGEDAMLYSLVVSSEMSTT